MVGKGLVAGAGLEPATLGVMKAAFGLCICDIESHNFNVYYNLPPLQSTSTLHRLTCFDSDFHRVT